MFCANHTAKRNFCLLAATVVGCLTGTACGDEEVKLERSGLVYGLGAVHSVSEGAAQIDLGDVHTVQVGDKVSVFRAQDNYFIPVGVIEIAETSPTVSRCHRSRNASPKQGDVVMFVREFDQLRNPEHHRSHYVRQQLVKSVGRNHYSSQRRGDVAVALADYDVDYRKWERSKRDVIGFLYGKTFVKTEDLPVRQLLRQIDMMREFHRTGRANLSVAGPAWESTMSVLFGPTVAARNKAAQNVVTEDEFGASAGPELRDIRRVVNEEFYDRLDEEQKVISYLAANALKSAPRNIDSWFQQRLEQSQFPTLAGDDAVMETVRTVLQKLSQAAP